MTGLGLNKCGQGTDMLRCQEPRFKGHERSSWRPKASAATIAEENGKQLDLDLTDENGLQLQVATGEPELLWGGLQGPVFVVWSE